jgi:hypothetical protein
MSGSFTAQFNIDYKKAENFIECLEHLHKISENFDLNEVYKHYDNKTINERKQSNEDAKRKERKREKKSVTVFKSKTLKKPQVQNIARQEYRKQCEEKRTPYNESEFNAWYSTLPDSEMTKYKKELTKQMSEYTKNLEAEKQQAIENGDFEIEDVPKALGAYQIFFKEYHSSNYKDELSKLDSKQHHKFILSKKAAEISSMWSKIKNDESKLSKYNKLAEIENKKYEYNVYQRNIRVLNIQINKCKREGTDYSQYTSELEHQISNPVEEPKNKVVDNVLKKDKKDKKDKKEKKDKKNKKDKKEESNSSEKKKKKKKSSEEVEAES